ncbi:MAG: flagellar hook-basal body complex protein FliE [Lachnospiraceae bacterium]|jgi:flagellar hook-basal body complex protein FliE|nr:flagellar hook-basal body complex protein FliE [Lachnospiraceae bacterium]
MDTMSAIASLSNAYENPNVFKATQPVENDQNGFQKVFQSALDMLNETSDLQNKAESAEIQFALGLSNNTHDLQVAQQKANIALQYTIAVRDKAIDAYKEIMNMSL